MIIAKYIEFEASHQLPNSECYGACRNFHGHTYKLTVEVEGPITEEGWVMNFKDLKALMKEMFFDKWDHNTLNKFFVISTAEVMSQYIFNELTILLKVRGIRVNGVKLYETRDSYAYANSFDDTVYKFVKEEPEETHEFKIN